MVNIRKLKGKMVEKGIPISEVAKSLGVDRSTLYRKLKGGGKNITIKDANLLVKTLELDPVEAVEIFFSQNVARNAN